MNLTELNSEFTKLNLYWIAISVPCLQLAFSPQGQLASGGYDGTVQIWDWTKGLPKQTAHHRLHLLKFSELLG